MVLSVDPGVHSMAIACWEGTRLAWAGNAEQGELYLWGYGCEPAHLYGEIPVVYPGAKGLKTDPNDLIALAYEAGRFYGCFECPVTLIKPAGWKGQVPKDITKKRILSLLDDAEINAIVKGGDMHNVFDAIGIGLFGLGRAKRGMVKP